MATNHKNLSQWVKDINGLCTEKVLIIGSFACIFIWGIESVIRNMNLLVPLSGAGAAGMGTIIWKWWKKRKADNNK